MVEEEAGAFGWPPAGAPLLRGGGQWPHSASAGSSSSVNAVSFGFVATAILISMFLVMAIFEKLLLRPGSPGNPPSPQPVPQPHHPVRRRGLDIESQAVFTGKLGYPSPKLFRKDFDVDAIVLIRNMR
ncbi:hypothetical protein CRG98_002028 [Punica granatum]|uniref:Uncharacterized protein n=1 Tax=Punica granatum TaxID=22663 RepID=A0A2I0LA59_PUNGR|nr:hypothetical protein CRG98_002028 [Punica granatum]